MANNKITNRKALAIAINAFTDMSTKAAEDGENGVSFKLDGQFYPIEDVIAKLEAMAASLDNKSANPNRKPTKTQQENEALRQEIMDFLRENPNLMVTCTDLSKRVSALNGLNNQKISALMRGLVEAGAVDKYTEKGKSVFQLAAPVVEDEDEMEDEG